MLAADRPRVYAAAISEQFPPREHASASASRTRRSLPDVGELAHTQFITAMLIALAVPCGRPQLGAGRPILGAEWERTASGRSGQARSPALVRGR